jgi:hypothetical protein
LGPGDLRTSGRRHLSRCPNVTTSVHSANTARIFSAGKWIACCDYLYPIWPSYSRSRQDIPRRVLASPAPCLVLLKSGDALRLCAPAYADLANYHAAVSGLVRRTIVLAGTTETMQKDLAAVYSITSTTVGTTMRGVSEGDPKLCLFAPKFQIVPKPYPARRLSADFPCGQNAHQCGTSASLPRYKASRYLTMGCQQVRTERGKQYEVSN